MSGKTPEDGPKIPWPIAKRGEPFVMGLDFNLAWQKSEKERWIRYTVVDHERQQIKNNSWQRASLHLISVPQR
jgi:hypothetical protein